MFTRVVGPVLISNSLYVLFNEAIGNVGLSSDLELSVLCSEKLKKILFFKPPQIFFLFVSNAK